jgi:hypothetical protein
VGIKLFQLIYIYIYMHARAFAYVGYCYNIYISGLLIRQNCDILLSLLVAEVLNHLDTSDLQFNTAHTINHNKVAEFHQLNNEYE